MSFILEYFSHEVQKTYEDPKQRQAGFQEALKGAQTVQEGQ